MQRAWQASSGGTGPCSVKNSSRRHDGAWRSRVQRLLGHREAGEEAGDRWQEDATKVFNNVHTKIAIPSLPLAQPSRVLCTISASCACSVVICEPGRFYPSLVVHAAASNHQLQRRHHCCWRNQLHRTQIPHPRLVRTAARRLLSSPLLSMPPRHCHPPACGRASCRC
ncbi:hypothetical protein BU16DRAFT_218339 [Lophium mytilinum]|uniref:Uncharacterized protein n=1 Tax=Lophium mytilinum TaxID=390894 RepID=A0A6A6QBD8_9PEZI|nr:hypothetical protein BU16DRAFT_218339 [Lophium mytilinum]